MAVQAVQNFKTMNSIKNVANHGTSNVVNKVKNSEQVNDSFIKSNQVAFKGNLAKVGENLLGDAGSKIGGKARRLGEEVMESVGGAFRKLAGRNELPMTEKPIVAAADFHTERMGKTLDSLEGKGIKVSDCTTPSVNGGFTAADKSVLTTRVNDSNLPSDVKEQLKNQISSCGRVDNADIPNSSLADDVSNSSLGNNISDDYDVSGVDGGDFDCDSGDIDLESLISLLGS